MKRFLSKVEGERQAERLDEIEQLVNDFTNACDWDEAATKKTIVNTADRIIKLVKKAKKCWLRGGFVDRWEIAHSEESEPPFAGPTGEVIPEMELNANFRMATIERPKTKHLKLKGKK